MIEGQKLQDSRMLGLRIGRKVNEMAICKSSLLSSTWMSAAVFCFLLVMLCGFSRAEEQYIVSSVDGNVNVYNLSDNSFVESFGAGANPFQVVVSPNRRIGYFPNFDNAYASVVDFTIQREIKRIFGVNSSNSLTAALTPDGKLLLIPSSEGKLDVIRTTDFQIIQRVDLTHIVGPISLMSLSSVVVVNNKAYINTSFNFSNSNAVAVVDLTSFQASAIPVPQEFSNNTLFAGDTAATPDGKYVLMLQSTNVLLISTASDTVVRNITLSTAPYLTGVTPVSKTNGVFGYLISEDGNGATEVEMIDLRPGSPTFGQLIAGAQVELSHGNFQPGSIAINSDGTRLIAMAFLAKAPQPDTFILDTAALLTNPQKAILSKLRLEGTLGRFLHNVIITKIETAPPPSAPVVTAVEGSPVNNQASMIQVSGANFGNDTFVRIGAMVPIHAHVVSERSLELTVPENAPAGDGLDVIVTNVNANAPVEQQQQSGLLAGQLKILPNPAFQPHQQVVTSDMARDAISVLLKTDNMKTLFVGQEPGTFAFAPDGVHVYVELQTFAHIACFNLQKNVVEKVVVPPLGGTLFPGGIVTSSSPTRGTPVIYVGTYGCQPGGECHISLLQIDANSSSPTFNEIVNTYQVVLPTSLAGSVGATPDGRYVYASEAATETITIFDIVKRISVVLSTKTLGVSPDQNQVTVAPDGKTLLLSNLDGGIAVFDIGANPLSPAQIATIRPVVPNSAGNVSLSTFQIQGNKLFAFDAEQNTVEMFNFDRSTQDYAFLGASVISGHSAYTAYLAVSPDGKLVYVPQNGEDALAVLDADILATNEAALITKLATGRVPNAVAVSPVP
jgi:DNA-binding beta-propeller fold protein YncE